MAKLYNFYTAYNQARDLYGVELTPDQFENIGMIAWGKIGNNMMELKQATLPVVDQIVTLPCDVHEIEAVTSDIPDYQKTSATKDYWNMQDEFYTEQYIDATKSGRSALNPHGQYVKYDEVGPDKIKINYKNMSHVHVLYKATIMDDDGLPMLNDKEIDAIAVYCAYTDVFKKGLQTRDANMINLSQALEQKWYKACDHARTPMHMNQNDFDAIGDVIRSWDRKTFGHSFKPIR